MTEGELFGRREVEEVVEAARPAGPVNERQGAEPPADKHVDGHAAEQIGELDLGARSGGGEHRFYARRIVGQARTREVRVERWTVPLHDESQRGREPGPTRVGRCIKVVVESRVARHDGDDLRAHIAVESSGSDQRVVRDWQQVADVVTQRSDDEFVVGAVSLGAGSSLEGVGELVDLPAALGDSAEAAEQRQNPRARPSAHRPSVARGRISQ